jgi:hypothetical protein
MTCGLPPDSRATTHAPNAPPGYVPFQVAALVLVLLLEAGADWVSGSSVVVAAGRACRGL